MLQFRLGESPVLLQTILTLSLQSCDNRGPDSCSRDPVEEEKEPGEGQREAHYGH